MSKVKCDPAVPIGKYLEPKGNGPLFRAPYFVDKQNRSPYIPAE
jgi:hypothetical protein